MPEDQKENVQEVVQPEAGNAAENTQSTIQEIPKEERPSSEGYNWKEVREKLHHKDDLIYNKDREITALREELKKVNQKDVSPPPDPLEGLSDDDVLTVADTKKVVAQYARRISEEVLNKNSKKADEERLKKEYEEVPNKYSDFNDVIKLGDEYLKENPTAQDAIMRSPNPREAAYHMIKSSSLYQRHLSNNTTSHDAMKVIENSKKPGSSQSVGTSSPLNEVGRYEKMTTERAAQIRKQAEEYASRR